MYSVIKFTVLLQHVRPDCSPAAHLLTGCAEGPEWIFGQTANSGEGLKRPRQGKPVLGEAAS